MDYSDIRTRHPLYSDDVFETLSTPAGQWTPEQIRLINQLFKEGRRSELQLIIKELRPDKYGDNNG